MRTIVAMVLMGVLAACLGGCQTLTRDSDQQIKKYGRIADMNRRLLAEDMDSLLLLDQPSSLTRYHIRRTY